MLYRKLVVCVYICARACVYKTLLYSRCISSQTSQFLSLLFNGLLFNLYISKYDSYFELLIKLDV